MNGNWQRVLELFGRSLELDPDVRAGFLAQECSGDESLQCQVERLLTETGRLGDFLEEPVFSGHAKTDEDQWRGVVLTGRYRIGRFVARGGAGTVYLAHDQQLADRPVIVKFMHAWAREYPWLQKRFRQEMEALARIDHYGVVGVLDAGETGNGLPFLVMEYVDGITLRSAMCADGMEVTRAARLIRDIGRAASAAHEKGVLHRDLKPENIMLEWPGTPSETVRLIDFGIARVEGLGENVTAQTTQFAGTTPYMAPEHLMGKPAPASDIYAIGVIAYEMLTGRRPFAAGSPVELYEQQRSAARNDPRNLRAEIADSAARAILRQLSFKPENRSATAAEAGESIAAALVGPRRDAWTRRRATAVLATGAAVATGGGTWWWRRMWSPLTASERVIEYAGGAEPLELGFVKDLDIDYHTLPNADATGYDSIRVFTADQGSYSKSLTGRQSRAARLDGWRLIIEAALEEGGLSAVFDCPEFRSRYIVNLLREAGDRDVVRLVTALVPQFRGLDWFLPGSAGARHRVELVMPARAARPDLWVDGVRHITGYEGMESFHYGRGLLFGAGRYRSQRASGVFWTARLEIGV